MTVEVDEGPIEHLADQAEVSIAFLVERVLTPVATDDGITFREEAVSSPWTKDYDVDGHRPTDWSSMFDVSRWGLLVARDGDERVGGAVIAFDTPGCFMLRGRRDLAVLWDLRVRPERRSSGVGARLWHAAEAWARTRECRAIEVETQNVNVAACRFYARMGCTIGAIDRFAYASELPNEVRIIWHKPLSTR